ncbi:hypothetical protein ACQPT2_06925 [Erwinia amylovora]
MGAFFFFIPFWQRLQLRREDSDLPSGHFSLGEIEMEGNYNRAVVLLPAEQFYLLAA